MRQAVMKRHSKSGFCELLIMNRNYSVLRVFSSNLIIFSPLSANPTKWSNTLKQFVGN